MTENLTDITFFNTHGIKPSDHPMWEQQLELEAEMRSAGIARFRSMLEKSEQRGMMTGVASVRRLMVHAHAKTVEAFHAFMAEVKSSKAGRRHVAAAYLADADPDVACRLTLRALLDTVSQQMKLANAASRVATLIEDELHFNAFREQNEGAYNWSRRAILERSQNRNYQRRVMNKLARNRQIQWEDWTDEIKVRVGTKMIELVVEATGLFELRRMSDGRNFTNIYVTATQETLDWIKTENSRLEPMSPIYLPCLMPPRPWTSPVSGGYWSGRVRNLRLVKTHNRAYLEDLENADMQTVYDAVNAMQNTAWQINRPVYEVMRTLWDNQSTLGNLPMSEDEPLPEAPLWLEPGMTKEDMTPDQLEQFMRWKAERAAIYETNAKAVSKRLQFSRMLWVAERFKDVEEFYFPYQLDFRGRVYAVPLFLNPQGNDAARGLLTFANTVPITDQDGADWLAIHGASLWGVDKVGLQERVEWVIENEAAILASAENPYDNRFWATAEKPWQALAFCFEWAGFKREGFAFHSSLPVQMDGTCNGLQNFSAMLLDEIGGRAVNLVPGEKPNDIYQTVADVVVEKLQQIAAACPEDTTEVETKDGGTRTVDSEGALARKWLAYGVTRKVTKRPVMTLAYGATKFGFRQQVFDDIVSEWRAEAKDAFPFEGAGWEAARFMGDLIWQCVGEVVVAARGAMDWLQEVAKIASKQRLPVIWTAPTGFKVMQEYTTAEQKRLELTFQKGRPRLQIDTSTKKLDVRKQSSGISPNWVHSMDAAHMQRTVARCHAEGIRSFSLIHDSYGTHAGNAWAMAQFLREEFVRMYSEHDVLAEFREEIAMLLGVEPEALPKLPPKGSLDLHQVLESDFFFA